MNNQNHKTHEESKVEYFKTKLTRDLEKELNVLICMNNGGGLLAADIIEELAKRFDAEQFPFIKTANTIFHDCTYLTVDKSSYTTSYVEFLKYFADISTISRHNLIIGINFTYGWMPTTFNFRSEHFDEAVDILNDAKMGKIPSVKDLEKLKGLFNRSLVGTSKLLHFINPRNFGIWDTHVYNYLTGKKANYKQIGDCELYLKYLAFCTFLTRKNEYEKIHNSICDKVGYQMTKMRTLELAMYLNGRDTQKRSK